MWNLCSALPPSPSASISTYLDPGVVSLIEVMYCLFYWSCVLSKHQCRVHSLACTFPLSKQTLDLCFEAFIKQKHPLWSLTGWLAQERKKKKKKNTAGVPLTRNIPIMPTQTRIYTYTGQTHTGSYISTYDFVSSSDTHVCCVHRYIVTVFIHRHIVFFFLLSHEHTHTFSEPAVVFSGWGSAGMSEWRLIWWSGECPPE